MVTIPPYHPMIIEHTSQVGIVHQQEKQNEEKKVTVQNPDESDKARFEREKREEEKRKKKQRARQKEQLQDDKEPRTRQKHRLDVIV